MGKAKTTWLVVIERDGGIFERVYGGPDRRKARERASEALKDGKRKETESVIAMRVSRATVLSKQDLAVTLPRDAF